MGESTSNDGGMCNVNVHLHQHRSDGGVASVEMTERKWRETLPTYLHDDFVYRTTIASIRECTEQCHIGTRITLGYASSLFFSPRLPAAVRMHVHVACCRQQALCFAAALSLSARALLLHAALVDSIVADRRIQPSEVWIR